MAEHRFLELADGFRIECPERSPVTVRLQPWFLEVTGDEHDVETFHVLHPAHKLAHHLAGMLICPWSRLPRRRIGTFELEAWAIVPGVFDQLERLRAMVDPRVIAVHKALLDMPGVVPEVVQAEAFFREPYVAGDVVKYRAAVAALSSLEGQLWPHFCRTSLGQQVEPTVELAIDAMRNWRGLFSPDGKPYRSLNRTLMNLPPGVPEELLCQLRHIRLTHPMTEPLPLTTLLLRAADPTRVPELTANHLDILQHATVAEIHAAVARIANCTQRRLHADNRDDIRFVLRYLGDYPEAHRGRLPGLVDKAIRWHHDAPRRDYEQALRQAGGHGRATTHPPIPLPEDPRITFLASAGKVVAEGIRMHHCIGSYVEKAVAGRSFLFHIEYQGEMASVEVSSTGFVEQSCGPHNTQNAATVWGRRQLEGWGRALRPAPPPPIRCLPSPPRRRSRRVDANQLAFPFY